MAAEPSSSLANFLAGVQATFGWIIDDESEHADFVASARQFYSEYRGDASSSSSTACKLPFWRYLIHYSALGLDRAATMEEETDDDDDKSGHLDEMGAVLAGYWPLIPVIVKHMYRDTGAGTTTTTPLLAAAGSAVQSDSSGEEQDGRSTSATRQQSSTPPFTPSVPLVPPVSYDFSQPSTPIRDSSSRSSFFSPPLPSQQQRPPPPPKRPSPTPTPRMTSSTVTSSPPLSMSAGVRSLSSSTADTTTTLSTEGPQTPPISGAAAATVAEDDHSFASMASGGEETSSRSRTTTADSALSSTYFSGSSSTATSLSGSIKSPPASVSQKIADTLVSPPLLKTSAIISSTSPSQREPRTNTGINVSDEPIKPTLILADRGDNAAKLFPTPQGSYVLQVSIGGRKLVYNPERPTEISYHDHRGEVVTHPLFEPTRRSPSDASVTPAAASSLHHSSTTSTVSASM